MKTFLLILGFLAVGSASANIFGRDDRVVRRRLPWHLNSVGSLGNCTAVLVARNIVLTAAHCVIENQKTVAANDVVFQAGLNYGKFYGASPVLEIHRPPTLPGEKVSADWALLVLAKPLGDKLGWMPLARTTEATAITELPGQVSLAGYSGDLADGGVLSEHSGCRVRGKDSYMFLHDCDFTLGASGAPIFSLVPDRKTGNLVPTIWALNLGSARLGAGGNPYVAQYETAYANGAIPLQDIAAKLESLTTVKSLPTIAIAPPVALTSRE